MDSSLFSELLKSFSQNNSFSLQLVDNAGSIEEVQCSPLTLAQLREILSCANDPTPVNSRFNKTIIRFLQSNLITSLPRQLTLIDKLCFVLQTRVNSISSIASYEYNNKPFVIDVKQLHENVIKTFQRSKDLIKTQTATDETLSVEFGLPLLATELQLFEEIYTDEYFNGPEETLASNIIFNEICSYIYSLKINSNYINLTDLTFSQRISLVEKLPVSLTVPIIEYMKQVKLLLSECTKVEGVSVPLDYTLFLLD